MKKKILLVSSVFLFALVLAGCGQKSTSVPENQPETMASPKTETEKTTQADKTMRNVEEMAVGYMDISPAEAKKMIDENPNLIVIDVSPNYAKGHLPRAINYYVGDGSLDKAISGLDKNAEYLVYCHVDSASILGSQKLIDAGFKNVYRLEGNYQAWLDAGYPIEK